MNGRILFVGDAPGGNYVRLVREFIEKHRIEPGRIQHVNVEHDNDCPILGEPARRCTCQPRISLRAEA